MRRLLVFGTGAAVIGTLLLITAFYETYLIVNGLQSHLNTAITQTSNNLLEASSIEAVFLGIMAALGYVLIAQGLEGIRKQELVDMQRGTSRLSQPAQRARLPTTEAEGERPRGWLSALSPKGGVAQEQASPAEQPPPAAGSETQKTFFFSAQPPAPSGPTTTAEKLAVPSGRETKNQVVSRAPETVTPPGMNQPVASTLQEPERHVELEPSMPVDEPVIITSEQTTPTETATIEAPAMEEEKEPTYVTSTTETSGTGGVAWEGGPPAPLEGVEVLPEPRTAASWVSPSARPGRAGAAESEITGQIPTPEATANQEAPARKRGRGRPRGTKKKKSDEPETSVPDNPPS